MAENLNGGGVRDNIRLNSNPAHCFEGLHQKKEEIYGRRRPGWEAIIPMTSSLNRTRAQKKERLWWLEAWKLLDLKTHPWTKESEKTVLQSLSPAERRSYCTSFRTYQWEQTSLCGLEKDPSLSFRSSDLWRDDNPYRRPSLRCWMSQLWVWKAPPWYAL